MKRALLLALVVVASLAATALTACTPTSGRYIDLVFASATKTTHLYKETTDLTTGADLDLFTDVYRPSGDTLAKRPVVIWIHGGGFKTGNRTQIGDVAAEWARRGYVTLSISYRLDPGNRCQEYQDGKITDPAQAEIERARCERAIVAATNDAFSAVGWIQRHAAEFGVDPTRIAVGGSSAGATAAVNVGQWANVDGGPVPSSKRVKAVLAMSGCQYDPARIDANDAPIAMLASGGDPAVPFECSVATVDAASALGTPTVANYYPSESGHAKVLYRQHQAEVDEDWTAFVYQQLKLSQPS
jgi:dienelactone hydrolase